MGLAFGNIYSKAWRGRVKSSIFLSFFSSYRNLPLCIKGGDKREERRKGAFYGHPRVDLFKTAGSLQAISKK